MLGDWYDKEGKEPYDGKSFSSSNDKKITIKCLKLIKGFWWKNGGWFIKCDQNMLFLCVYPLLCYNY